MQARYHYLDQSVEFADFQQQCRIQHIKLNNVRLQGKKIK